MPVEVILPKVDMDMSHGTIAVWHVAEGDAVSKGEALFDIETDKAAMEVEAPATGRLRHIAAEPGARVAVGTVLAWIYAEGEVEGEAEGPARRATTPAAPPDRADTSGHPGQAAAPDAQVADARLAGPDPAGQFESNSATAAAAESGPRRATPAARALARSAGIDLAPVSGTGPLGRVQREDVAVALSARALRAPANVPDPVQVHAAAPGWSAEPGPLHVSRSRGEGRALVLIHGLASDSQGWAPLEKALGTATPLARPLIRFDLPCHGRSPRRAVRSFADLARMLAEAFDDAVPDGAPVHLVGHSLGGALALALADIRSRRIASLTLIAPAGLGPEIDAGALAGIIRASRAESLLPWLRRLTATPEGISEDYARAAMAGRTAPALRAAQGAMAEALFPDGTQAFDLTAALARLSVPTAVLWGRDDHILPFRHALAADGEIAIHLLKGAGHIPHVECPDRVAAILSRHIAAAEARAEMPR
jgi:pyruvate dehydrogenase E2 component (dihydrolipoamide acetyltransferase)